MRIPCGTILAAAVALAAYSAQQPNLRGFGRVEVGREVLPSPSSAGGIAVLRFSCETAENAETVAGKFLMDLYDEPGVSFKDGIHETKGGAAFAVERDGRRTVIYGAESREALEEFVIRHSSLPPSGGLPLPQAAPRLAATAAVPPWMDHPFQWRFYGMGGLSGAGWMEEAKKNIGIDPKADKSFLDPRDDAAFLKELGVGFDIYVEQSLFDNSDGVATAGLPPALKIASDFGLPLGARFYLPAGGTQAYGWFTRRFSAHMERPATWMQNGWLRYHIHQPHISWFDKELWGYTAAQAKKMVARYREGGKIKEWMHPAGELLHQPWYDWHSDYSGTAAADWRDYLRGKGVSLQDAAAMYHHPERPFASWEDVPVPEFATFAGLDGMVLDLEGTWQTTTNDTDWTEIHMPGSWDFLWLYGKNAGEAMKSSEAVERRFRRVFEWNSSLATRHSSLPDVDGGRVWLYFFPMTRKGGRSPMHEVSLNGGEPVKVGQWCALDVTDKLREGENTIDILLRDKSWNGRIFLSTERPEMYPNMSEARCRLWTLWHQWRREAKYARSVEVFDAMRQAEPNAPVEYMAPRGFGSRLMNKLMRDWGGVAHFTGEGSWFFPWYKRYAKLYGYQGTSELAGPSKSLAGLKASTLRVFLAGLDMHKPVFVAQTYSRDPEMREWLLAHKDMIARQGTYDIDIGQPQVLIYRREDILQWEFPVPYPVVDETVKESRSPWNYDLGRGSLQSIGQSFLYLDDNGIEDGKMDGFRVMLDCGNEIISEEEVARIQAWVEKGGVFVAYPFTGRNTLLKADAWPMASLTGTRAVPVGRRMAIAPDGALLPAAEARRRQYGDDMALEPVADDVDVLVRYADGRPAITVRRIGEGLVVHLGSFYWRGSEDVNGIWNPQGEEERSFLRELLAFCGQPKALVETDDRLVLAQPYRSHDGLDLVAVLCNFNEEAGEEAARETTVKLRTGSKPRRIVAFAGTSVVAGAPSPVGGVLLPFSWDEPTGTATVRIALLPQEVAVLNAECYGVGDALDYWWRNSAEQWHELKKPTRDFSKYYEGEWKDPTQDLKEGWDVSRRDAESQGGIPLDCLQYWGWPDGKGALCRKAFDLDDPSWAGSGAAPQPQFVIRNSSLPPQGGSSLPQAATRLVAGVWFGTQWLTPGTIRLNGEELATDSKAQYLDFDVTALLKPTGNVLEVEFADASDGQKFTGMNGSIYLYRREAPETSIAVQPRGDGGHDYFELFVPAEWKGKYRVRLYMEGGKNVPKGVKVRDRFMRKHHHNFGNITDIDITDLLRFGETNRIGIGANSPAEHPDKTSTKSLTTLRIDLYPQP